MVGSAVVALNESDDGGGGKRGWRGRSGRAGKPSKDGVDDWFVPCGGPWCSVCWGRTNAEILLVDDEHAILDAAEMAALEDKVGTTSGALWRPGLITELEKCFVVADGFQLAR